MYGTLRMQQKMYAAIANALRINVFPQLAMHFPFLCNAAS